MAVITISRELGSEGDKIADLLCQGLGYCRVDSAMLAQIAEEAGVNVEAVLAKERAVTRRPKLVSSDMTSLYRKDPSAFGKQDAIDDQTYARVVRETMEKYAQEGNAVIIVRGGQMVLQDWPTACPAADGTNEHLRSGCQAPHRALGRAKATIHSPRAPECELEKPQVLSHGHRHWPYFPRGCRADDHLGGQGCRRNVSPHTGLALEGSYR
jgi:hypothetical protein